ncbi:AAA family ATPase, partial [bacterium]|nr:AAA family ATPase [bacterium]
VETTQPVELYSALFSSLQDVDARSLSFLNREIEEKDIHPLGDTETRNFLKKLVIALSPHGQFETHSDQFVSADFPRIWMDPVLFIRSRAMGFARAVESVIADLQMEDADIPDSLSNIAGVDTWTKQERSEEFDPVRDIFQDDILFSKSANIEQMQIAKHLERNSGVLVQGPPGTGKSHTIGNLIGHLLAQGKQILVTSHTTKALRVLRSHLPEELQSLCVSLLESDTEGQDQLKHSVTGITSRLQDSNVHLLEREAADLQTNRATLIRQIKELTAKIKETRADEYRDIQIGDKHYSPSEAARVVHQRSSTDGWIPDAITLDVSLAMTFDQIRKAYFANEQISIEDEEELKQPLPDSILFPDCDTFDQNIS